MAERKSVPNKEDRTFVRNSTQKVTLIGWAHCPNAMATSKTASFWLTETVEIDNGTLSGGRIQGTIDLGAYVDVGDQQALAIEQVDVITQVGGDFSGPISQGAAGDYALNAQLMDLNPGTAFVQADDNTLIASAHLDVDQSNNSSTATQDFFPDTFGKIDESRITVNDQLYFVVGIDGAAAITDIFMTVRIKARIVKLSTKDWIAIAVQSTAADN